MPIVAALFDNRSQRKPTHSHAMVHVTDRGQITTKLKRKEEAHETERDVVILRSFVGP
jgi:hypothetical protein